MVKYNVGQLVVNKKLGLGKVLEVRGDSVTVYFKDQKDDNPRTINVAVMPMEAAELQTDECLDDPRMIAKQTKKLIARKKPARRINAQMQDA